MIVFAPIKHAALAFVLLAFSPLHAAGTDVSHDNWPQWRGPLATGAAPRGRPPVVWGENKNIRWKIAVPGQGHATPIVWGDRVFLTAAVPHGPRVEAIHDDAPGSHDNLPVTSRHRFVVLALHRSDGRILWQQTVHESLSHEGGHVTGSLASNSPVTDGQRLFVSFGSHGIYCLNLEGRLQWQAELGRMQTRHAHGEGSSPALHGDTLVVNWDHEGDSFLIAFDKHTGEQRWKVPRDEMTSWSTPIIVEHNGRAQVIVSATKRIAAYDLADGHVVWTCGGLSRNVVASPVAGGGVVYTGSSYDTRALLAIRLEGAAGDITGSDRVLWVRRRYTPYVPSPLLVGRRLYVLTHNHGVLNCIDGPAGSVLYGPVRLMGLDYVFASPVAAGGHVYFVDRNGSGLVIKEGDRFDVVAQNHLDDGFSASPAVAGDELFLRGHRWLYCIAGK